MDLKLAIALGLLTLFFIITIYLIIELKVGSKKRVVKKTRKEDANLEDMANRLQNIIQELDSEVNKDQMMQEITSSKVSFWVKLRKNIITTLINNKIGTIEIIVALGWLIFTGVVVSSIIPGLGPIVGMLMGLPMIMSIFNMLNIMSMWLTSGKMRETYAMIEQNTNHYHSSKNFVSSVSTTLNSLPKGSWVRNNLERFETKMTLIGNYPIDRAIDELKEDLGNIRYVNIYLDRVKAAETVDTRYKDTINGISGLYKETVMSYTDFTQAMVVGMLFLLSMTVAVAFILIKNSVLMLTSKTVINNPGTLMLMNIIGTAGLLVAHLIFFVSTQPNQERRWGGGDNE